jgi:hypothetical protein
MAAWGADARYLKPKRGFRIFHLKFMEIYIIIFIYKTKGEIIMTIDKLRELAATHADTLREYRLSGDIADLHAFIEVVIAASDSKEECIAAFKQDLTHNEFNALYRVIEKIGTESGNISIVKMVQETSYSRPVYTNLLAKLEKHGIATVVNQGVKGTNIKFLCDIREVVGWV